MIVLAIDTCDSRGSVAVLRDGAILGSVTHQTAEDYSSWLLPAVNRVLREAGIRMEDVDAYAAASGPGSFTGVRVGLTTVKAWAEVYGKPIVGVSRLEAIASQVSAATRYVAASANANRGQVFGAIYRRNVTELERLGDEMVLTPGDFVAAAAESAGRESVSWVSIDPDCMLVDKTWQAREKLNESIEHVSPFLAQTIAGMAAGRSAAGHSTDALRLDANYVRRSDAEIFWKGGKTHGG
ncbi:MAG TPA: tRNA (adenosine(37)-N6)-threonylcarbamoyltransferase complex dimerization subunit type 1 TsaB [Candidatus Acidoferrum sp.]|nr:tRNA (adenosine(37)-N6)-threonylcarbamoyltransferase complex dimerization subunit type 1 TsaB [Candidatus Acidoferrum sp.]